MGDLEHLPPYVGAVPWKHLNTRTVASKNKTLPYRKELMEYVLDLTVISWSWWHLFVTLNES